MNEFEKAALGLLYDANNDETLLEKRMATKSALWEINHTRPDETIIRAKLFEELLGSVGANFVFDGLFQCDYGTNIHIGHNFYANVNLVILDGARVDIGDNVFIAPNVGIYTAGHPLDAQRRNMGLEYALPIKIGNNVWIGAGASILPGVTIGDGAVIGSGAVVIRDVPSGVIAAGNPARAIRSINDQDRQRTDFSRNSA